MSDTAAALLVGVLFAIWWTLLAVHRELNKIAKVIEQARQDNIAWRENVWERDRR